MIEVEQTRFGGPNEPIGEAGNCFAACLASVLEVSICSLPEVPHIEKHFEEYDEWLKFHGLGMVCMAHDWDRCIFPGYLIAGCESAFYADQVAKGGGHVVIVKDGEVVWNPNPFDKRPLWRIQTKLDGFIYVLYRLDPSL